MSRVGKNPINMPDGVECNLTPDLATVKGKLGQLNLQLSNLVKVKTVDRTIVVEPTGTSKEARALWGTTRSNLSNLVKGVSEGFSKRLEITGVGYRAAVQGKDVVLQLGFSHEVKHPIPDGITVKCEKPTIVLIEGIDPQKVGQLAAEIRSYRKPEPYKGKGVKYEGEYILRKEGKKK